MKRLGAFVGVLVLGILAFTLTASAGKPERVFLPTDDFVLHGPCSFDVDYHVLANNEYGTTFSDGRFLVTGKFRVRLTNLSTRKAIDVNISGPGVFLFGDDGSVEITARGNWLFYFNPGMFGQGAPGRLLLTSGLTIEKLDATFEHVLRWSPSNNVTDACALLS